MSESTSVFCLPAPARRGIQQSEIAAAHGRYLRLFAKILLALVALSEKQPELA